MLGSGLAFHASLTLSDAGMNALIVWTKLKSSMIHNIFENSPGDNLVRPGLHKVTLERSSFCLITIDTLNKYRGSRMVATRMFRVTVRKILGHKKVRTLQGIEALVANSDHQVPLNGRQ